MKHHSARTRRQGVRGGLAKDQRGAVMIIGLFMALSLIASLWILIGIGDAIVFRDRMQEAADAVAFSSATVHARGMNMIAALNIIMFALVSLYLIMTVVDLLTSLAQNLLIACLPIPIAGEICAPIEAAVTPFHETYHQIWVGYCEALQIALPGAGLLQSAVGIGAPFGGLVAGINVGGDYDQAGLSFSSSMAPGFSGFSGTDSASQSSTVAGLKNAQPGNSLSNLGKPTFRIGLPVANEDLQEMCAHSVQLVLEGLRDVVRGLPVVGHVLTAKIEVFGFGIDVWQRVENALALVTEKTLCPSKYHASGADVAGVDGSALIPWENGLAGAGSKRMWYPAQNGNDWMQVWGFILNPEFKTAAGSSGDTSENKVSLAATKGRGVPGMMVTDPNVPAMYVAQAEFYFDCKGAWHDDDCEGSFVTSSIARGTYLSKSLYSIRWRARLRRVRTPDIGGMLVDSLSQILQSDGVTQWARGALNNSAAFKKTYAGVQKLSSKFGGQKWADEAFGYLLKKHGGVDIGIRKGTNALDNVFGDDPNAPKPGLYH